LIDGTGYGVGELQAKAVLDVGVWARLGIPLIAVADTPAVKGVSSGSGTDVGVISSGVDW